MYPVWVVEYYYKNEWRPRATELTRRMARQVKKWYEDNNPLFQNYPMRIRQYWRKS